MKNSSLALLLFLLALQAPVPSTFAEITGTLTEVELDTPTEIDGIPCKKEALLFPDGKLEGCLLARDTTVSGHLLPEGSWPYFDPPGVLKCVFLNSDFEIQEYLLRGEGHNYQTCFHPNGRLKGCRMSRGVNLFEKYQWIEIGREGNVVNVEFKEGSG